ncbi:hypothetical protein BCR43DRAFT_222646 [Syncephalastrum racemosum]|uniref:Uncharacterized protein n=1 Tax=Syncephalastrum racemosum TaxID=13706 RepID=A0A1X2HJF6_SYNRA|nr:hypothetical protein BCR43DRAFT_222646 [Syncephalastrum racemosum]
MTTKKPSSTAPAHAVSDATKATEPKEKENAKSKADQPPAKKKKKDTTKALSAEKTKTSAPAAPSITTPKTTTTTTSSKATASTKAAVSSTVTTTTTHSTDTATTSRVEETEKNAQASMKPFPTSLKRPSLWVSNTVKQRQQEQQQQRKQQQQGNHTRPASRPPAGISNTTPVILSSTANIPLSKTRIPKVTPSASEPPKTTPLPLDQPAGPVSEERSTPASVV